jgi:hypothetical protein
MLSVSALSLLQGLSVRQLDAGSVSEVCSAKHISNEAVAKSAQLVAALCGFQPEAGTTISDGDWTRM